MLTEAAIANTKAIQTTRRRALIENHLRPNGAGQRPRRTDPQHDMLALRRGSLQLAGSAFSCVILRVKPVVARCVECPIKSVTRQGKANDLRSHWTTWTEDKADTAGNRKQSKNNDSRQMDEPDRSR